MKTIIEMAREADLDWQKQWDDEGNRLERFAALVRADERERLTDAAMKAAGKAVDVAMAIEREACAEVCEEEICNCCWDEEAGAVAEHLAAAIRARGNT